MKKEWVEHWRTLKFPLLLVLFVFLGILNPLTALLTPDLLEMVMGDQLIMEIPEPTSLDSWIQFYKNIPQLGLVVFVLVHSGFVSKEVEDHTLVNIITKGAKRGSILLAKLVTLLIQWTVYLLLSYFITWAYTNHYFNDSLSQNPFAGGVLLWVFGSFVLALLLLGSTSTRNGFGGLLIVGGVLLSLVVWNFFDFQPDWNPLQLSSQNMLVVTGEVSFTELYPAITSSILFGGAAIAASQAIFKKKKL